jgi:GT2 family glycosyltransferase
MGFGYTFELSRIKDPAKLESIGEQSNQGRWSSKSVGPALFELVSTQDILPSGWVLLEGTLVCRRTGCTAKLYYNLGDDFDEKHSIAASISRKGKIHELICLPNGIKALRWQVACSRGEFVQSRLTMRSVSWIERVVRMVRRVVSTRFKQANRRCDFVGLTRWRMLFDLEGAYAAASRLRGYTTITYRDWIRQCEAWSDGGRDRVRRHINRFTVRPQVTVVVPTASGSGPRLTSSLKSLGDQLYRDFSVVVIGQSGALSGLDGLDSSSTLSGRIQSVREDSAPRFLAELCRSADQSGEARYVAILEEGDALAEHALYWIVAELQRYPRAAMFYSDSDNLDSDGTRIDPRFKPDWSPELLRSMNYLGGLVVYRADTLVQGDDTGVYLFSAGAQHDLALRIAEKASPEEVVHVPAVLYHRRFGVGDEDSESSIEAVRAHLARLGIRATLKESRPGCFHVRYALPEKPPLVSILIPTRDGVHLLRECVESVLGKTTYSNFELIVIDNQSRDSEALTYLASLERRPGVRLLRFDRPFNFSAINNFGAEHARGEVLCLLNNDTEVISPDWLEEMVGRLVQDRVGVVGAKLFFPDGRVQHAGDAVGPGGCADHMHGMIARDDPGYCNRAVVAQDLSAVTGACLITWKKLYRQLGGLDEKNLKIAFNDVDYCLRVREAGYRVVWTPHAELYHHESVTRGQDRGEEAKNLTRREAVYMRSRWRHVMKHDPFYNPNLSYERPDFSLNVAPMVERPWLRARPWWRFW